MSNPLTRKIGPLPAYAYAVGIGGAFLLYRLMKGSGSSAEQPVQLIPTGAPQVDMNRAFLDDLSERVDSLAQSINTNTDDSADVPSPNTRDDVTYKLLNDILKQLQGKPGSTQPAPPSGTKSGTPKPYQPGPFAATVGTMTNKSLHYATTSLSAARAHALRVIRDYSPGGALYGKGAAGSPATRTAIPYIKTSILSAKEQLAEAKKYSADPRFVLSATGPVKIGTTPTNNA